MRACPILMNTDGGGIDHHIFAVRVVLLNRFKKGGKKSLLSPVAKVIINRLPRTKTVGRQIAPGRARAQNPKDALKYDPVVYGFATAFA